MATSVAMASPPLRKVRTIDSTISSTTTDQTTAIEGLGAAYNMGTDLSAFLAIVAVGLEGDPLTETWSIGKGIPTGLGSTSNGLYGVHNKYEGDSSIMRVSEDLPAAYQILVCTDSPRVTHTSMAGMWASSRCDPSSTSTLWETLSTLIAPQPKRIT